MARGEDHAAATSKRSRSSSSGSSDRERKVELPTHMRYRFLHETSHLPTRVFRHLESYIKPRSTATSRPSTPPKKAPAKQVLKNKSDPTSSINTTVMDLGADVYTRAEGLGARQEPHDPQRESSSAAASRAKQHLSSSGSSSRYSDELARSPDTDEDPDLIHFNPVYKSRSTRALCKLNEMTYSSQYTRPATDMLKEILEVRYPAGDDQREGEERPLLPRATGRKSQEVHGCWWRTLASMFSRA